MEREMVGPPLQRAGQQPYFLQPRGGTMAGPGCRMESPLSCAIHAIMFSLPGTLGGCARPRPPAPYRRLPPAAALLKPDCRLGRTAN